MKASSDVLPGPDMYQLRASARNETSALASSAISRSVVAARGDLERDSEYTARFCHRHDQNAFDPAYENMPLEAFVPMVQRVMARPKKSIYLRGE